MSLLELTVGSTLSTDTWGLTRAVSLVAGQTC
jgi:hypothetical protein